MNDKQNMGIDMWRASRPTYSGATRVVFIVGDPVAQVKAPFGLTRAFRKRGADLIVVPARVAAEDFSGFAATVERMGNADGMIVTVPHKFAARRICAEVDAPAARVGSVNLMRRRPAGGWFGTMTDGEGCLAGLRAKGFRPAGKRALLVGAGGAGIAVADALVHAGIAELGVFDVDEQRLKSLIETIRTETGITVIPATANPVGFDLVVNATLLGTAADDPLPIETNRLSPSTVVADLACGPAGYSALVRGAAARGCLTMTGDEMFDAVCNVLADFFIGEQVIDAAGLPQSAPSRVDGKTALARSSPASSGRRSGFDDDAARHLRQLLNGYQATQAIHAAAVLGVADHLTDIPASVEALAVAVHADSDSLYRCLRAIAALGVFREHEGRTFSIAPMGAWLRTDADPSVRPWAIFLAEPSRWQTWGNLVHSVRSGENAFKAIHGVDSWEYRRRHPEQAALFQAAMTANSQRIDRAIVAACDLAGRKHIGDLGGGQGSLLAAILLAQPDTAGTLFDQPHVVAAAKGILAAAGVLDRCRVVGGDLFAGVPSGCDALVLKFVLHDWSDADAIAILRSCRRACGRGDKLFVVEYLIEPPNAGLHAKMSDINMFLGPGGRERTVGEYDLLLREAGFTLKSVVPTDATVSILNAEAC